MDTNRKSVTDSTWKVGRSVTAKRGPFSVYFLDFIEKEVLPEIRDKFDEVYTSFNNEYVHLDVTVKCHTGPSVQRRRLDIFFKLLYPQGQRGGIEVVVRDSDFAGGAEIMTGFTKDLVGPKIASLVLKALDRAMFVLPPPRFL